MDGSIDTSTGFTSSRQGIFKAIPELRAIGGTIALSDTRGVYLAYGSEHVPKHFSSRGIDSIAGDASRPGAPVVELQIRAGKPLRMSVLRHPFTLPPKAEDLSHAETQLAVLENHVLGLAGLWNRPLASLISRYFDALRDTVHARSAELERRAGDLAGLVEPLHWCFAAPMPLPRAHLGIDEDGRLASSDAIRSVRVDLAFQDSNGIVALENGGSSRTPARKRALEALTDAGVRLIGLETLPTGSALLERLGADFLAFPTDVALPESPFRGKGIVAPIS